MKLYGLLRGSQWVCLPSATHQRRRATRAEIAADLTYPGTGEPLFLPGLTLGEQGSAWTSTSLDVAMARQRLLAALPSGWVTSVARVA